MDLAVYDSRSTHGVCLYCVAVWATLCESGQSVENWIGVNVCTGERMTAGEEMLMIFMGNKQDIYLQADRCTWPLGWLSYTRKLGECLGKPDDKMSWSSTEAEMKKHRSQKGLAQYKLSCLDLFFLSRNQNVSASAHSKNSWHRVVPQFPHCILTQWLTNIDMSHSGHPGVCVICCNVIDLSFISQSLTCV